MMRRLHGAIKTMGFPSLLEDIQDVKTAALDLSRHVDSWGNGANDQTTAARSTEIAKGLIKKLNELVKRIDATLSIATDPEFKLAAEYEESAQMLKAKQGENLKLRDELSRAHNNERKLAEHLSSLNQKLKLAEAENQRISRELTNFRAFKDGTKGVRPLKR